MGIYMEEVSTEALLSACSEGRLEVIRYLCNRGVNVNYNMGEPLYLAILNNHYEVMKLLIEKGADPYLEDRSGSNAVDIIYEKLDGGDIDEIDIFLENNERDDIIDYIND